MARCGAAREEDERCDREPHASGDHTGARGEASARSTSSARCRTHTLAPVQIYAWMGVVFAGVMIGGLGSAIGPLAAGFLIGVSEALTMAVTAPTWAPLVSFSLLIAIILLRPARF